MAGWRSENAGVCKTSMRGSDSRSGLQFMKKSTLFIVLTIVAGLLFVKTAQAQTFDFNKAYQDYQYIKTVYDQSYSDYQDARNAYQRNPTLSLKEEARKKTLTLLINRDQLLSTYLTALRTKIQEDTGLSDDDKNNIFGKIDAEVLWYNNDKSKYNTNDSLETLFGRSSESASRYKTNTILTIDESLIDIGLGEETSLRLNHEQTYSTIKSIIDAGVASGKLSMNPFNHWLSDIDTTDQLLKQNEAAVKTQVQKIYSQSYSPQGSYEGSVNLLLGGIKPLSQLNEFLREIISFLKNQ